MSNCWSAVNRHPDQVFPFCQIPVTADLLRGQPDATQTLFFTDYLALKPELLMAGRGASSYEGKMPKIPDSGGFKLPGMIYILCPHFN